MNTLVKLWVSTRRLSILVLAVMLGGLLSTGCDDTPLSSAKEITEFGFDSADNPGLASSVTATVSGTTISAKVPYGTDVSALKA
ncbi:MAG TPA: hypothetical protein VF316_04325, partial [Polyangiaceae bacterium]